MTTERRTYANTIEVRAQDDGSFRAVGYAAVFDKLSEPLGGFVEKIGTGAFTKTAKEADVRALFNHDPSLLLGRSTAGTLKLDVDERGLKYEIDLPPTQLGRDVAKLIERGDISGSSFGFKAIDDDWDEDDEGRLVRTLNEVRLYDVGPVTFPAYTDTEVDLRSLAEHRSLDLDHLIEAARSGRLPELVSHRSEEHDTDEESEQAVEETPARRFRRVAP